MALLKSFGFISVSVILLVFSTSAMRSSGGGHNHPIALWPPSSEAIQSAFADANIVPDILDEAPKSILNVQYGDKIIKLGGIVDTPTYLNAPIVRWPTKPGKLYTLFMLDPDSVCPLLPYGRNSLHWLVSNIKRNNISGNGAKTNAVYIPPWSGPEYHRYVFLVFEQPGPVTYEDYVGFEAIAKFDLNVFIQRHRLPALPRFGNFYQSYNASAPEFEVDCDPIRED